MEITKIKIKNPGILMSKIPEPLWTTLSDVVENHLKNKFKKLSMVTMGVGGIYESINFSYPTEFELYLKDLVDEYQQYFGLQKIRKIDVDSVWINLQKKFEYRPLHNHVGNLSFIFYYKIPYKIQDENRYPNNYNVEEITNGRIGFLLNSLSGEKILHHIDIDSSYEGKILLFNSNLLHTVYPFFTSDETRISVAGNIFLR